ncbi:MAG: 6,7-dimethyl-8-ribityllumazine synthase [Alphaproteobacteria bacterium]|nr:6,7-dimethyl-8-ribityllumazine synthase [Alphaproteobacteria bacterium]
MVNLNDVKPHIMIVQAKFYPDIADELLLGATTFLTQTKSTWKIYDVPGVFEIAAAMSMAIKSNRRFDGFLALGCVIRGETTHYDQIVTESARALQNLAVQHGIALGYGILTVENSEQAWARAKTTEKNKGREAAQACVMMAGLRKKLGFL